MCAPDFVVGKCIGLEMYEPHHWSDHWSIQFNIIILTGHGSCGRKRSFPVFAGAEQALRFGSTTSCGI